MASLSSTQAECIRQASLKVGFHKVGLASMDAPPDLSGLTHWIEAGFHADMAWMTNPKRWDPALVLPGVRSVICVAMNYYTPVVHSHALGSAKISRYAWGRDYHRILGRRLKQLSQWIEQEFVPCQTRWYVDTGPIAEKPWAMQAGVGWIGKNSLLLTREYGSWIFLGVILTTLDLPPDPPHTSHCGTCTRCLEACPTDAIVAPHVVDSNRCIAYHTLENQDPDLPNFIKPHLHGWVAGCDICQDVCPWNQRFAQPTEITDFHPYAGNGAPQLHHLAVLSATTFETQFTASALRRLKVHRLRRNAQAQL